MTMIDELTRRIAEVLRKHQWYFVGNLGVPGMPDRHGYKCLCGWQTNDDDGEELDDPHVHVAQVVGDAVQLHLLEGLSRATGLARVWLADD